MHSTKSIFSYIFHANKIYLKTSFPNSNIKYKKNTLKLVRREVLMINIFFSYFLEIFVFLYFNFLIY